MKRHIALFAALILPALTVLADDKPQTPTALAGGTVLSVEEAKKLLDAKGATFFDTRNAVNYGRGHIRGAISISYKEKSAFKADFDPAQDHLDLAKLPGDKNARIVIYSDGPTGWKSYKAAVLAIKDGRKNVMWMRAGTDGWTAKGFPME